MGFMQFHFSKELGSYMTSLEKSLHMGGSLKLKLFLLLQDQSGTPWPEVLSSDGLELVSPRGRRKCNG